VLVEDVARIYIKEVFVRYRALSKIVLDRDLRGILSEIRSSRSNLNSVLSADGRIDRKVKLDTRTVSKALY